MTDFAIEPFIIKQKNVLNCIADILLGETEIIRDKAALQLLNCATDMVARSLFNLQDVNGSSIKFREDVPLIANQRIKISSEILLFMVHSDNVNYREFLYGSLDELAESYPIDATRVLFNLQNAYSENPCIPVSVLGHLFGDNQNAAAQTLAAFIHLNLLDANKLIMSSIRLLGNEYTPRLFDVMFNIDDVAMQMITNLNIRNTPGNSDAIMSNSMNIESSTLRPDYAGSDIDILDRNLLMRITTDKYGDEFSSHPLMYENGLAAVKLSPALIEVLKSNNIYPDKLMERINIKTEQEISLKVLNNEDKRVLTDIYLEYSMEFPDMFIIGSVYNTKFTPQPISDEVKEIFEQLYKDIEIKYEQVPKTDTLVLILSHDGSMVSIPDKNISVERVYAHTNNRTEKSHPIPDGGYALHNSMYDRELLLNLLHSIRINDKQSFIDNISKFLSGFPDNLSEARTGFKEAFTSLFITGNFPYEGVRDLYCYFLTRCGQIH